MADKPKGLLDQLLEEAMQRGADTARDEDYAVSIRDADGNQVDGIPVSKAAAWLHDKFGIGEPPEEPSGDSGKGEAGEGGKSQPTTLKSFLAGKKAAGA